MIAIITNRTTSRSSSRTRPLARRIGTGYTRSPLEDSRLFGPSPWKILATTYDKNIFLSNPAPGENLLSGNLVMEIGRMCLPDPTVQAFKAWPQDDHRSRRHPLRQNICKIHQIICNIHQHIYNIGQNIAPCCQCVNLHTKSV